MDDALAAPADLPRDTFYQVVHTLHALLPPPPTDTPDAADRYQRAAIAHVASLRPTNPEQANLAAQYIGASAHALDCMRLARQHPSDVKHVLKCLAQSASMMRQAHRWRTALLRSQAEHRQPAPAPADADLAAPAAPPAPPQPATPNASATEQAERFAQIHRQDAILIRRGRHVPSGRATRLAPEVVQAILTGTTPILSELDKRPHRPAALAA